MGHILWSINQLANTIQNAIDKKFDFIIVIDGKRGLGKSTLAIKLALRFPMFRMKKHIVFKREDVMKSLATLKKHVIVPDEMINVTHNRDFYDQDQKKLIKMLNMYRDSGNIVIACVPNFAHLDNQFRDLIKMRIHIERRGLGIIHTPNQSSYSKDKWDMAINEKIEQRWLKRGVYRPNWKRLTTYRGIINFGPLTPKQQLLYDKIKAEKRNVAMNEEEGVEKESPYERVFTMIKNNHVQKKDIKNLAMAMGMHHAQLMNGVRRIAQKHGFEYKDLFPKPEAERNVITTMMKNNDKNTVKGGGSTKWS